MGFVQEELPQEAAEAPARVDAMWRTRRIEAPMDIHGDSQTNDSCLSEARKKTTREDYIEALRGEFVEALAALEEIQVAHGF